MKTKDPETGIVPTMPSAIREILERMRKAGNKVNTWTGSPRPIEVRRPCSCGCDARGGLAGVGYIMAADLQGNGITVWIRTEDDFQALRKAVGR